MTTFSQKRFNWSEQFIPQVRLIIERAMGGQTWLPTQDEDRKEAIDLWLLQSQDKLPFAIRLRKNTNFRDLTIRNYNYSGYPTEVEKLQKKDFHYFCGWVEENKLIDWAIVDMAKFFRLNLLAQMKSINAGYGNEFLAISIKEIAAYGCLVAKG